MQPDTGRLCSVQMKPPHGNRPSGSGRSTSDRGPHQGPGTSSPRPQGQGAAGPRREYTQRADAPHGPSPGGPNSGRQGQAGAGRSGQGQGGYQGPGQRPPNSQAPRQQTGQGPRLQGGQGFQPRLNRDGQPQRHVGPRPQYHDAPRHTPDAPKGAVWLYGHHAIVAALANKSRRLRRLLLTEEAETALSQRLPQPWALAPERVERGRLDTLLGRDIAHQGAALLADPLAPPSLQSVLERPGAIVVLDQVTDPRNIGAILRSAAAFGAAAVITQDRNAPEETGGLAKAASGALETMPLLRAVNIARTLIALKAANIWCVGLDAAGPPLSGPALSDRRIALVLGAEGEGLRRLTRETCDEIAGLSTKGAMESLNVSAAGAVALYELTRRV